MIRKLFAIASAISLLLCAAAAMLSVAGLIRATPKLYFRHNGELYAAWAELHGLFIEREPSRGLADIRGYNLYPLASILAILPISWAIGRVANRLRTARLRRLNVCIACGYNLTGNTSGVCPECGTPVPKEPAEEKPSDGVSEPPRPSTPRNSC